MAQVHMSLLAILIPLWRKYETERNFDWRQRPTVRNSQKPERIGRTIAEAIAKDYEARHAHLLVPDPKFAENVQAGIDARREASDFPKWD